MSIDVDFYTCTMIYCLFSWAIKHCNFTRHNLGTLPTDHPRNTVPTGASMIPYLWIKNLKTPTLYFGTYLYGPCKGVSLSHAGDKPVKQNHQSPKILKVCVACNHEGTRPWDLGNRQCC